jgi:DNA-binding transcriptional MerR regulator
MPSLSPQTKSGFLIGQAASLSGVTSTNIRFYETKGLIGRRGKGVGNYRFYSSADVHQLKFIRQLRQLDMSLQEVKTLLHLNLGNKKDCQTARNTIDQHLVNLRQRIQEMAALENEMSQLRSRCNGTESKCRLLEALHQKADSLD